MSIGADAREVAKVNATFADFARAQALPDAVRRSMNVVLDELLANVVSHGLGGRADGLASIDVSLHPDRLVVTLSDNGSPFNPFARAAPDTSLAVEDRPIGGLGIHLVRQLVDIVHYERRGDTNVVTLTKHLAEGAAAPQRGGQSMEISTRTAGDVTIVVLAGNLDSGSSPQAQQAIDAVLAGGGRKVCVDFSALDYISSAGLRVLLSTAKQLKASGGTLRLFGLNQTVREVFEISGFAKILAVFPGESEALSGL